MNNLELIAKQQLEIELLKTKIAEITEDCNEARLALLKPEQWSIKCPDFPKVAKTGIVTASRLLDRIGDV